MPSVDPRYKDVVAILDKAVGGPQEPVGAHDAFWRTLDRDGFVDFSYRGEQVIVKDASGRFDADASGLIRSIEGRAPFDRGPKAPTARFNQMPSGLPAMPPDDVLTLRRWITLGCPA